MGHLDRLFVCHRECRAVYLHQSFERVGDQRRGKPHIVIDRAPVYWYDEIDSTSEEAKRRARRGETSAFWITAHQQSTGKGRLGRAWASPIGNLYTIGYFKWHFKSFNLSNLLVYLDNVVGIFHRAFEIFGNQSYIQNFLVMV